MMKRYQALFRKYYKAIKAGIITSSAIVVFAEYLLWPAYYRGSISSTIGILSLAIFPLLIMTACLAGAISVRLYEEELNKGEVNILAISAMSGLIAGIVSMVLGYLLSWASPLIVGSNRYVPSASICIVFTAPVSMAVLAVIGGLLYSYVYSENKGGNGERKVL